MGQIQQPPLNALALDLARAAGLRDFLETGTFEGEASGWAAQHFDRVWTLEIDARYQSVARARNSGYSNVRYFLGDSTTLISGVFAEMNAPALCWLDAHAGAGYYAAEDNCPLLAELDVALASPFEHCILVDDARAFVAPPPPPFDYRRWPSLEEIFSRVLAKPGHHAVIIADTMIVVPGRLRDLVAQHCFRIRPTI